MFMNNVSTAPTKAEKLAELHALLDELFALKENQEKTEMPNSASDPEKINYTTTRGENR